MPGFANRDNRPRTWIENGALVGPVHIVVSPFKTGTTSVGRALVKLGVGHRIMPFDGDLLAAWLPVIRKANAWAHTSQGFTDFRDSHAEATRSELAGLTEALVPYDVFADAPFGHTHIHPFVRKVLAPEAVLIWVNRDKESWIASVRNWEETHPDIYPKHQAWRQKPIRQAQVRARFWRKNYRDFKRITRGCPDDCLELGWSDLSGFDALAGYYGVPVPPEPFPRENVMGEEKRISAYQKIRRLMRQLPKR